MTRTLLSMVLEHPSSINSEYRLPVADASTLDLSMQICCIARLNAPGSLPVNFLHPSTHKIARVLQLKILWGNVPVIPLQPDRTIVLRCSSAPNDAGKGPDNEVQPSKSRSAS